MDRVSVTLKALRVAKLAEADRAMLLQNMLGETVGEPTAVKAELKRYYFRAIDPVKEILCRLNIPYEQIEHKKYRLPQSLQL